MPIATPTTISAAITTRLYVHMREFYPRRATRGVGCAPEALVRLRRMAMMAAGAFVLVAFHASAGAQALFSRDAPKEPGAPSWAIERAKLPPFVPPRTADGVPDFRGRWAGTPGGDDIEEHDYVDISSPPEETFIADPPGGKVPYQPWALAKRNEIRAGLARGWPGQTGERLYADPQTYCLYMTPRATYRGGFDIQQGPGYVLVLYNFSHYSRYIPTDGRPHALSSNVKLWMGHSRGRWDGHTLVVDVTNVNGLNWLDQVGNFVSENVHLVERFTLVHPNIIDYEVTIDDPQVFTRPWTIRLPFRRAAAAQGDRYATEMWEHACHEGNKAGEHMRGLGFKWFPGVGPPR